ncbi:FAD/NAD(P)-binding domain-containing protein [Ophiobolus disseminans]|uniref:FAD/NAD(P)-binding domain-containing protein n=1 Tax=Ophiobolus disseminans TaxID=1469910 RepID=A0A6A6ZRR3_9PLEO|nr:FAD/NAD(P)-binding domain-containing protein [Ophiobolus disseminans]
MAYHGQTPKKPFRVIVVGAGLVGLSLSHALQLANIEHVVLEKHSEIVSLHGAALMIYPSVARVFDQFGILKNIQESITPVKREFSRWPDGSVNIKPQTIATITKTFDLPIILFDRQRCVSHLYEGLPDKSVIRTSTRVKGIEHTETGVKVHLADGTYEEGDLVIGADGVHSLTRQLMWDYAAKNDSASIPESDRQVLFTEFKGIYGVSNQDDLPDLGPSDVNIVLGHDVTKLLFTQPGVAYWALIYKDEYSQPPKPYRPDLKEQEGVAQFYKDTKFTENLKFGDLWDHRTRAGLLNIEEGILDKWHAGRIVLVGDSVHKMTADLGIGANMAIESATVLANVLQQATSQSPDAAKYHPSLSELDQLFEKYQSKRYERAKVYMNLSGSITRMRSYQSLWQRFFIGYIGTLPFMQRYQGQRMMEGLARGPKLAYVGTRTINEDAEGWKLGARYAKHKGSGWFTYVLVTSVFAAAVSYVALLNSGRLA